MDSRFANEQALFERLCADLLSQGPEPTSEAQPALDWRYILDRAEEHIILPVVKWHVDRQGLEGLPDGVRKELTRAYLGSVSAGLAAGAWLASFLAEAQSRDIPVIVLKGLLSAAELYPDPALRPSTDFDILVRVADVPRCAELLGNLGLVLECGNDLAELLRIYNHATYCPRGGYESSCPLPVELHWGFHEQECAARFSHKAIWDSSRVVALGEVTTRALSYEDELIFGAHHLCNHVFFSSTPALRWFLDLGLRIRRSGSDIDWDLLIERSALHKAWPACSAAFVVLHRIFHVEIPDRIVSAARKTTRGAFGMLLERISFVDLLEETLASSGRRRLIAQLGLNPGFKAKSTYAASRVRSGLTRMVKSIQFRSAAEI